MLRGGWQSGDRAGRGDPGIPGQVITCYYHYTCYYYNFSGMTCVVTPNGRSQSKVTLHNVLSPPPGKSVVQVRALTYGDIHTINVESLKEVSRTPPAPPVPGA